MATRIERVMENMKEIGLTQLIVADPKSIWYLTGVSVDPYERLFAFMVRTDGNHTFFLNNLFNVPKTEFNEVWFSDTDDYIGMMADRVDAGKLGIDKVWNAGFLIPLMERVEGLVPVLASDCVDDCRAVKDEEEKELMIKASLINDTVNELAYHYIKPGMTEKHVADFINQSYGLLESEGPSFTTIVSFGANAADPHHEPDDTVLEEGMCVLLDMGCIYKRYCSDMTRTFWCGEEMDPEFKIIYELTKQANEAAEAIIKPGVKFSDIDAAARNIITEAGYGPQFNHRLGHFIGQTDHEKGDVSATNDAVAREGMIFSIEPGIYLEGKFGVRIEDLVMVTADGCKILNSCDKRLRRLV